MKRNKIRYRSSLFLFIFILTISLVTIIGQSSVDTGTCKSCHLSIKPLTSITKDCMQCHSGHSSVSPPENRDPIFVHQRHLDVDEGRANYCKNCHSSPADCKSCHNIHDLNDLAKIMPAKQKRLDNNTNSTNDTLGVNADIKISDFLKDGQLICQYCHGALPSPNGHADFRDALKNSKHGWMNCKTCHIPPFSDSIHVDLHFKDLMETPINNSINLCKICHSPEYNRLKTGDHGNMNNTCVDCHNPHTTKTGKGNILQIKSPEAGLDVIKILGNSINSTTGWVGNNVPILKNPFLMAIFFILAVATAAEYTLSRHEEGKKVAYKTVKVSADEETLKTLEIKLENQNINIVNEILENNSINILGMTMIKKDYLYEYIIFIDIGKRNSDLEIDEITENIATEISSMDFVRSVEITDKYEL